MKLEVVEVEREDGEVQFVRLRLDCWETKWIMQKGRAVCVARTNLAGSENQYIPKALYNMLYIRAIAILKEKRGWKKGEYPLKT